MNVSSDFSWSEYIQGNNIIRAANFILTIDNHSIQEIHQPYAYRWLDSLKKQLERYNKRVSKEYYVLFSETARAVMIEQNRVRLQQQSILVANILTDDIQQQLIKYLNDPTAPVPAILGNERSG